MTSPHRLLNPGTMAPASGFSHVVIPARGQTIYLAGQAAHGPDGKIRAGTMVEQFDVACSNVVAALSAVGAAPHDLVTLHIYVTDVAAYRAGAKEIGETYRRHFGRHYPAMALFGVTELFDPAALVELVGTACRP